MAIHEPKGPVILVDTGDNVGGGSAADGTILLYQLLRQNARDAVMMIRDVEVVEKCFAAGVGAKLMGISAMAGLVFAILSTVKPEPVK